MITDHSEYPPTPTFHLNLLHVIVLTDLDRSSLPTRAISVVAGADSHMPQTVIVYNDKMVWTKGSGLRIFGRMGPRVNRGVPEAGGGFGGNRRSTNSPLILP